AELRAHPELAEMRILARGNRLSITPVTPAEWRIINQKLLKK
ncbi:MAG: EVE domain-containing protein, partial [Proteobacteria bacterium]|nr:EVE domain-containing protein [Pseudomonadota bacterium]